MSEMLTVMVTEIIEALVILRAPCGEAIRHVPPFAHKSSWTCCRSGLFMLILFPCSDHDKTCREVLLLPSWKPSRYHAYR